MMSMVVLTDVEQQKECMVAHIIEQACAQTNNARHGVALVNDLEQLVPAGNGREVDAIVRSQQSQPD